MNKTVNISIVNDSDYLKFMKELLEKIQKIENKGHKADVKYSIAINPSYNTKYSALILEME